MKQKSHNDVKMLNLGQCKNATPWKNAEFQLRLRE